MVVFSLVASHTSVDLETVARLNSGAAAAGAELSQEENDIAGLVTLATCNRFEMYAHARSADHIDSARSSIVAALSRHSGLRESEVSTVLATHLDAAVPRHLFAVSTGLESAVVGEREIAGQVRRALSAAQGEGRATAPLVRLFQAAAKTAKDVGATTALGQRGMSIVSVALDLAAELHDSAITGTRSLAGKSAVLFGTGAYAGAAMAQLIQRGCTDISVYSASGRAETFTASRGGTALTVESLSEAVSRASLLLGCSGTETKLSREDLAHMRQNPLQQLTVIDLALSHDFAPDVSELAAVDLLTLETVRQAAPVEQESTLNEAATMVAAATQKFQAASHSRSLDHAIVALRQHTMAILDQELDKVRKQHGCSAATAEVEFAMRRMVKALLHLPTVRAKELAAGGDSESYLAALDVLYGLQPSADLLSSAVADAAVNLPTREAQSPNDARSA